MRKLDKQRQAEQEARRQKLHAKLGSGADNHSQIIVNEGADGGHFFLNDHIAQRVKKHQIEGIRFLWDSTITGSKELQGCLLAHTMGLGKTMQA
jgi:SNF2 family DNA or RNA helicase